MSTACTLAREGDCLRLGGPLERDGVATTWPAACGMLDGVRVLDLAALTALDSAGLAMLGELAARSGARVRGGPATLAALRRAYRLDADLQPVS